MSIEQPKFEQKPEIMPEQEKPERFELKGNKKEVEYSGVPLDVYLADKHLQVIDVREDPRWNADYLLIDPDSFDQLHPKEGFKGIREGEPFMVGRNNPLRFELPNTVSRDHLKIELREGKLILEDLGSKNGTVIELTKLGKIGREIGAKEVGPEKERTLVAFRDYISQHREDIENELRQGRDLDEIFYHDFYSRNIDNLKYKRFDLMFSPEGEKLVKGYKNSIETVHKELQREMNRGRGHEIGLIDDASWLYCGVNGGFRRGAEIGRFYLNLKPENVPGFYFHTVKAFQEAGLHIDTKIPIKGDADHFNRLDKMVIYFNADEEKQVLQLLEKRYSKAAFEDTGIPRFAAEVKDSRGQIMNGVGFGEEPSLPNESFGSIRAKILAKTYNEAKDAGLTVMDQKFNFEKSFRETCEKYQVDPASPAFNLGGRPQRFAEIKERNRTER